MNAYDAVQIVSVPRYCMYSYRESSAYMYYTAPSTARAHYFPTRTRAVQQVEELDICHIAIHS